MSFQMSKFGNGKTRETMQKKSNEKKTKRIVQLFFGNRDIRDCGRNSHKILKGGY